MNNHTSMNTLLAYKATHLTQAAEAVLARENLSRDGLSELAPIAHLALAPFLMPDQLAQPMLADHLENAGLSQARAIRLMRSLFRTGPHQAQFAERLVKVGADPARLRDMTLAESSEYLVPLLAKL